MSIQPAFAVPFVLETLPDCAPLNAQLRELFLAREADGDRWRNPHASMQAGPELFESDFTVFSWEEACVQQLRDFCWGALARTVAQLNRYGPEEMHRIEILSHTWFHVTRRGGAFGAHNHPMASWSGVYCVATGEHDAGREDSGMLQFSNPHHLANMFMDPGNSRVRAPYGTGSQRFGLAAGQLILFPSWLVHEVLPFHGEGERITLAFNCWFKMREGSS